MQENFKRNLSMTKEKLAAKANLVKIIEKAVEKCGSVPELQRVLLTDAGVKISHTALYNALKGQSGSIKPQVVTAICNLFYAGDWAKCGKDLNSDFLSDKLKNK
jgi:hypothetical protein